MEHSIAVPGNGTGRDNCGKIVGQFNPNVIRRVSIKTGNLVRTVPGICSGRNGSSNGRRCRRTVYAIFNLNSLIIVVSDRRYVP